MAIVGTLVGLAMWLVGVPLALVLGLIAGLLEFPILGPILGYVPVILVSLLQGPQTALSATLAYNVIQQLEGNALVPIVERKTVYLPPVLTLVAVFLGGALFGPLGVVLSTPLVAAIYVLVKMLYVEDVLGRPVELPGQGSS